MLNITDKPSIIPPIGWEGMYSADLSDYRLHELGSVYADSLEEIVKWLKGNNFALDDDDCITGMYDGIRSMVMIWHQANTVGGRKLLRVWDK